MSIEVKEQETTINFSRSGKKMIVWTSDSTVMTKLDKLVKSAPSEWEISKVDTINGEIVAKEYRASKSRITFRGNKRQMTDEQRRQMADRLRRTKGDN